MPLTIYTSGPTHGNQEFMQGMREYYQFQCSRCETVALAKMLTTEYVMKQLTYEPIPTREDIKEIESDLKDILDPNVWSRAMIPCTSHALA